MKWIFNSYCINCDLTSTKQTSEYIILRKYLVSKFFCTTKSHNKIDSCSCFYLLIPKLHWTSFIRSSYLYHVSLNKFQHFLPAILSSLPIHQWVTVVGNPLQVRAILNRFLFLSSFFSTFSLIFLSYIFFSFLSTLQNPTIFSNHALILWKSLTWWKQCQDDSQEKVRENRKK